MRHKKVSQPDRMEYFFAILLKHLEPHSELSLWQDLVADHGQEGCRRRKRYWPLLA
jgi:hypothetical protein